MIAPFVATAFVRALLARISNDNKLSILGVLAGALVATKLDWGLLLQGDAQQLGTAAGVVVTVLVGYYSGKPDAPKAA